jgi:glucose/arabinose dehydrogenase
MTCFVLAALAAACAGGESTAEQTPVEQGAPNTSFTPAFPGQTRAPEARSGVTLDIQEVARGLEHPWALAFLPNGDILVTERPGRMRVVRRDGVVQAPIEGLPAVDARMQGGVHDVALSPAFAADRLVYWTYAEPRGESGNGTSVARGRLSEDGTRMSDVRVIFRQTPAWRSSLHFGSQLVFDAAGRLYVALGERSLPEARRLAQDIGAHLGKIVRINADGSTPGDNPFVGQAGALPEIWSYGHRNVQGAELNPETGELWIVEHGPRGGDEINVARPGRNYGWPVISYGEDYSGAPIGEGVSARGGMEQPLYYWDPVIAPGDMIFYQGALFPWRGNILIAGLRSEGLVRLVLDGERIIGEERFSLNARVREVAEAADGALWVLADEPDGRLLRLSPR